MEKLGHFFIADEFFDCNQAILSLGGEGCSRSAVLAILILNSIRRVAYTVHNFRAFIYYIRPGIVTASLKSQSSY